MGVSIKRLLGAAIVAAGCATGAAADESITFTSWGGTTQDAQKASWADKFESEYKTKVLQDGPTDYGKLKAMVDSGQVN
jgi:putative spermidine/putrescine transport system substrate-binding protein